MAQIIKLNIIPKGIPDVVNVSQFDVGRIIQFDLYDDAGVYTIPSGATVTVAGRKGDNHIFIYEATIAEGRHAVSIETTEQMTAWAGENLCQLRITKTGIDIATVNFRMMVQERPDANGDISDSDLPMIIALATEQELNAEAWAVGTKDGTAVASTDPQYHNNSKYYKEQAATSATNAANSATAAATSATNAATSEAAAAGYVYGMPNALSIDVDGNPIVGHFAGMPADALTVDIEPIQDLHGYDYPWIGGAGKNKFNSSVFSDATSSFKTAKLYLKANTQYTMSGNKAKVSGNSEVFFSTDSTPSEANNSVYSGQSRTLTTGADGKVYVIYRQYDAALTNYQWQIEEGNQATTYKPYSNICPISGLTEIKLTDSRKNLLNPSDSDYGNYTITDDGGVSNGQDRITTCYIKCSPNTAYTISTGLDVGYNNGFMFAGMAFYDANKNFISRVTTTGTWSFTATTPSTARFIRFFEQVNSDKVSMPITPTAFSTKKQQLEVGSEATAYEPYNSNTYTIDLNGTRYGGTLDVKTGVLTVKKVFVEYDGSNDENWSYGSSAQYIYITPTAAGKIPSSQSDKWDAISNYLTARSFNELYFDLKDGCGMAPSGNIVAHISGVTDIETDLATIKTYLSNHPLQFCYELATPITVQLDPETVNLLKGYNRITSNGNTVMHLSAVPEKLINYIVNAFGTDESGRTTASRAYAAKEYFYKDGFMYKVISAIAQNAAFTVGTNCVQTTIFAELTALNA